MKSKTTCLIMGGGRGSRLYPLTDERCKPAVPLAGKYRLVDIPISNCLNSKLNQIYLLTQFNTASLHRHIQESYKFDPFSRGFVDILSAEQTQAGDNWYQGTADAVRQNLHHIDLNDNDLVLILSGDQLYQMDFRQLIDQHIETGADVTISAKALRTTEVLGLGLMRVDEKLTISEFVEKPTDPKVIADLVVDDQIAAKIEGPGKNPRYVLANMGIYCFKASVLRSCLQNDYTDFGKEIIPTLLTEYKVKSFVFQGYWEDIGTVRSLFNANLDLTEMVPSYNFFDNDQPVYTHARYLPASKINGASMEKVILADGCILNHCELYHSVIGVRSFVDTGTKLNNVVMMGADRFETVEDRADNEARKRPHFGVGSHCLIRNAIIDKNARIGHNVKLDPAGKPDGFESGAIYVRDGVLIVRKNGVVPDGTQV
ncbi:MAG: glucose-1-phosphate adenylyltransferase [Opitutales bacterium]